MARGDYVEVTYRTGAGTEVKRIQARKVGGTVEVTGTDGRADFVTVEELDKTGKNAVRTARFAKTEVVAIDEGNAPVLTSTKTTRPDIGKKTA